MTPDKHQKKGVVSPVARCEQHYHLISQHYNIINSKMESNVSVPVKVNHSVSVKFIINNNKGS